jgi:hypothetical protein
VKPRAQIRLLSATWIAEQRLLIAGKALMLGKVLSRTVRRFLNEQLQLFPAPPMNSMFGSGILTLAAGGRRQRRSLVWLGVAKITIDMHVGAILTFDPRYHANG